MTPVQESGPYLVRTERTVVLPEDRGDLLGRREVTVVAVATLDGREVYNALYPARLRDSVGAAHQVEALPVEGGTIKLPDGSTITVEQTTYRELYEALPAYDRARLDRSSHAAILEHANARFANDATRGEGR